MVVDIVAATGGHAVIDMGACGGAFGHEMPDVLGELDSGALGCAFRDEMAGVLGEVGSVGQQGAFGDEMSGVFGGIFRGVNGGVVRD